MTTCEVCGVEAECVRSRIEGAVVSACGSCAELGETLSLPKSFQTSYSSHKRQGSEQDRYMLREDFGQQLQKERQQKGLSREEMAHQLQEKTSVIRRVETGDLTPDALLLRKLQRLCSFSFYEQIPVSHQKRSRQDTALTIGDIARLKER